MRITTKGRYALRAVVNLATSAKDKPVPIKQIAQEEDISPEFLEQIFFRLKKAGLIRSVRGPGGGFLLNKRTDSVTIKDIFEAVGEGVSLTPCTNCGEDAETCCRQDICLIHDVWVKVTNEVAGLLDSFSIKKIIESKDRRRLAANQ